MPQGKSQEIQLCHARREQKVTLVPLWVGRPVQFGAHLPSDAPDVVAGY